MRSLLLPRGRRHGVVFTLLYVAVMATPAFAQHGFVQGGIGVESRRFSASEDDRVFDADASTVTVGAHGFLSPRFSAGVELDLGAESSVSQSVSVVIGGRPTTVTTTFTARRRGVSALAGFHTPPDHRVRAGVYGGISFTTLRRAILSDALPIILTDPIEPAVFTDRTAGPVAGCDLAVRIAPAVAVGGSVRAQGLSLTSDLRGYSVRPAVFARVMF